MRARLRYLAVSPRPIRLRPGAGYVVGLLLAVFVVLAAILGSMAAHAITTTAAAGILAVVPA